MRFGRENPIAKRQLLGSLLIGGTYLFLLLLSYGFPVAGDDWFFTTRHQNEGVLFAIRRGFEIAKGHYYSTNGRYLGNAFSGMFGCSALLREVFRCGLILGIFLLICRLCKIRHLYSYLLTLALVVALPPAIFAQTYAWAAGFFNYVPPLFLILAYFCVIDSLFLNEAVSDRPYHGFILFLLGLCTQFFVENITVAMCLLSGALWLAYTVRKRRCSWKLSGHLAGVLSGCVLMFMAPGYHNVGIEGYREASGSLADMLETAKTNFFVITKFVTEDNWFIIGAITLLCLFLLCKFHGSSKRERLYKQLGVLCLTVPLVFFYANQNILDHLRYKLPVRELSFWADIVFNVLYLAGVVVTICLCVKDAERKIRAIFCVLAAVLSIAPLTVVTPIGPRCFYVAYLLLVCLTLLLGGEVLRDDGQQYRLFRLPVMLASSAVLFCYLWMMIWNGHAETVRVRYTEEKMAQQATEITLPSYPYPEYAHGGDGQAISVYYYYQTPGDIIFHFIAYYNWSPNIQ